MYKQIKGDRKKKIKGVRKKMKLTKEECKGIIQVVANWGTYKQYLAIKELVNEHFELIKAIEFIFGVKSEDVLKEYEKMWVSADVD